MQPEWEAFWDEAFLRKLEKLRMLARRGLRGPEAGTHKSWPRGEGLEFLDYREYQPGDDLRYVDWSVYGRLDKLLVKLLHAEKNQTLHLLLDMSASMAAGSPPKALCARKIAAAVGYIGLANLDKIGLAAFATKIDSMLPPVRGKKNYPALLQFLLGLTPADPTDISASLSQYALGCKQPGVAVILSDLFDPKGFRDGLRALRQRNFDVHLIQILDRRELFWDQTGHLLLEEIETGQRKRVLIDRPLLERYRRRVAAFVNDIAEDCRTYGIGYALWDTRIAVEDFLVDYLTRGAVFR
ncbi:MAG: DUF58 domain-containing protein [Desulfobacterales bacterium]|nr:DUF58 domain-containing protein [Desulfobacterales bacterium]